MFALRFLLLYTPNMKDLPTSAQSAIEYGVVALLLIIIISGSYKLYKNWTTPEAPKTHQTTLEKNKKILEKPSKELCSYVMQQCRARYDTQ